MPGYVCIAMLEDPPYNIYLQPTKKEPKTWCLELSLPSILLFYEAYENPKEIVKESIKELNNIGIKATPYKAFPAKPHEVITTVIKTKENITNEINNITNMFQSIRDSEDAIYYFYNKNSVVINKLEYSSVNISNFQIARILSNYLLIIFNVLNTGIALLDGHSYSNESRLSYLSIVLRKMSNELHFSLDRFTTSEFITDVLDFVYIYLDAYKEESDECDINEGIYKNISLIKKCLIYSADNWENMYAVSWTYNFIVMANAMLEFYENIQYCLDEFHGSSYLKFIEFSDKIELIKTHINNINNRLTVIIPLYEEAIRVWRALVKDENISENINHEVMLDVFVSFNTYIEARREARRCLTSQLLIENIINTISIPLNENDNNIKKEYNHEIEIDQQDMIDLARFYRVGNEEYGISQDKDQAESLYLEAFRHGNYHALIELGEMYMNGRFGVKNMGRAVLFFNLALDRGLILAYLKNAQYFAKNGQTKDALSNFRFWLENIDSNIQIEPDNLVSLYHLLIIFSETDISLTSIDLYALSILKYDLLNILESENFITIPLTNKSMDTYKNIEDIIDSIQEIHNIDVALKCAELGKYYGYTESSNILIEDDQKNKTKDLWIDYFKALRTHQYPMLFIGLSKIIIKKHAYQELVTNEIISPIHTRDDIKFILGLSKNVKNENNQTFTENYKLFIEWLSKY